ALGPHERAGVPAEQQGLQLAPDAAREVEEVTDRRPVLDLVQAGVRDRAGETEQPGAGRPLRAEPRVGLAADPQDLEDVDQGLDVVDPGRLPEQAALHRERWLVPGLASL